MDPLFFLQLRACLGMQIVACCASVFNIILSMVKMDSLPSHCWYNYYENFTLLYGKICHNIEVSFLPNNLNLHPVVLNTLTEWEFSDFYKSHSGLSHF